jgi:glycosyltransferase involved in cell wall biosynthesis
MTYYGEALNASGFTVEFLSFGEPHACLAHPSRFSGMRRHVVQPATLPFDGSPTIASSLALVNDILQWMAAQADERLVLWGHYLYPYATSVLLASAVSTERAGGIDCLITPAGSDVWDPDLYLMPLVTKCYSTAKPRATIFYSSRFLQEATRAYSCFAEDGPTVIRPVLPDEHFRPGSATERANLRQSLGVREQDVMIALVSNMRACKNLQSLEHFLRIFHVLELKPVVLLVGPVREYPVDGCRVINTGVVQDVRPYLWASDLSFNVSLKDSFNFALLESMLCEIPTITTRQAAISDDMREVETASVVDTDEGCSVAATGELVRELLTNRSFAKAFGARQRKAMQQRFGLSMNCERFRTDIAAVLNGKGAKNEGL